MTYNEAETHYYLIAWRLEREANLQAGSDLIVSQTNPRVFEKQIPCGSGCISQGLSVQEGMPLPFVRLPENNDSLELSLFDIEG